MRQSAAPTSNRPSRTLGSPALSVRPDNLCPGRVPFLLEPRQQRLQGALGFSIVSHLAAAVLVLSVASLVPEKNPPAALPPDLESPHLVWIPPQEPDRAGGGGSDESLELPREPEMRQEAEVMVPVEEPLELEPEPEPDPAIPLLPMAPVQQAVPAILASLSPLSVESAGVGLGGVGPGEGGGSGGGAYRPGKGIQIPVPLREVRPRYTAEAMRAKLEGSVLLEAVVLPDGTVGNIQVVRSLDSIFGLDEEAVRAAKQWRFRPGTRLGVPVPVLVSLTLTFTLR